MNTYSVVYGLLNEAVTGFYASLSPVRVKTATHEVSGVAVKEQSNGQLFANSSKLIAKTSDMHLYLDLRLERR